MVFCYEFFEDEYLFNCKLIVDIERKFYGLWIFDEILVVKVVEIFVERCCFYNLEFVDII